MRRFVFKIFLFILPALTLVTLYIVCDPYQTLRPGKRFDNAVMMMPEGYVAWQTYLNNRDSVSYDAFILGNSCTMAFRVEEWQKHLPTSHGGIRFFENYESLGGVCQKLQALDSVGATVKHLLVVLDVNSLVRTTPHEGTPQLFDAQMAGLSSLGFQWRWVQEFIYPKNLIPYLHYLIRGHYTPSMKGVIRPDSLLLREPVTNNFINPRDADIRREGTAY